MTDRKEVVSRLLAYKTVIKALEDEERKLRTQAADLFADVGEREVGTMFDHRLGTVSLKAGAEYWTVADQDAFLEWVCANFADEVEEVPQVRSSFTTAVLTKCKRDGGYVDAVTGEIEIPQGVVLRKGSPTLEARTEKHAGFVVSHWLGREATEKLGIEA